VRHLTAALAVLAAVIVTAAATAATAKNDNSYTVHNLVSDGSVPADHTDANLVNAWGIAASSTSPWWVSDNGKDVSTLYDGHGVAQFPPTPLVVGVAGDPTGVVFNGSSGFVINDGNGHSGPAVFMFATEGGTIRGWNPNVPPPPRSTQSFVGASVTDGVFKGLAIAGDRLFVTDFHHGMVDVYDSSFNPVTTTGGFVDPKLPKGYAPFGIQNLGGEIFVTYGKQDAAAHDEVDGQGLGIVDEYTTDGVLIARVATHGQLNGPWGLAMAPPDFGQFGGDLLVGNFGDGQINAYARQQNGGFKFDGQLRGTDGKPLTIDGLWGIGFGNGSGSGDTNDLYFAAGPDSESHGLFGEVSASG
jgi:uncharacterized protein (TIGR03118 family)